MQVSHPEIMVSNGCGFVATTNYIVGVESINSFGLLMVIIQSTINFLFRPFGFPSYITSCLENLRLGAIISCEKIYCFSGKLWRGHHADFL